MAALGLSALDFSASRSDTTDEPVSLPADQLMSAPLLPDPHPALRSEELL